mgnify:CR=1 FL=1
MRALPPPPALFAFDCDGTLAWGNPPGPVTPAMLDALKAMGYTVVIISDSGNCEGKGWPRDPYPQPLRHAGLRNNKERYGLGRCVYVSDNPGDDARAALAGCEYMRPEELAAHFGK